MSEFDRTHISKSEFALPAAACRHAVFSNNSLKHTLWNEANSDQQSNQNKKRSPRTSLKEHNYSNVPIISRYAPTGVKAKLTVSDPNDEYEQEADRVADQVMRMPEPTIHPQAKDQEEKPCRCKPRDTTLNSLVQRQAEPEEDEEAEPEKEEEEETIQSKSVSHGPSPIPNRLLNQVHSIKGGGQPLPATERSFFEPRFGVSFDQVRIHSDSRAAHMARSINACAFTHGRDIVFGNGQYSQGSASGRKLLAHELTHVVQQNGGSSLHRKKSTPAISEVGGNAEIRVGPNLTSAQANTVWRKKRNGCDPPPSFSSTVNFYSVLKARCFKKKSKGSIKVSMNTWWDRPGPCKRMGYNKFGVTLDRRGMLWGWNSVSTKYFNIGKDSGTWYNMRPDDYALTLFHGARNKYCHILGNITVSY